MGEMMKKYVHILAALVCLLGLGATTKADNRTGIVVTLPFQFVVSGKTLPAGTYGIRQILDNKSTGLILSNGEDGTSVFLHPFEIESISADKPQVSFERVGEQRFLSKIQTSNDVYNIPVSRSVIVKAAKRSRDNRSASGSSGSK
jgi:hypothetical protein